MAGQGWIKVHRQIKDCWIYDEKPFDRTHAWIDLLMKANHTEKKFALGNELITVKRGSFITSELKLMDAWGWSKTKVRSFLKMLREDNMIEVIADKKKTTINIVNYSVYQESETTEKPQENHEKTIKEPQKDTNKNDKNVKNEKNDNISISQKSKFSDQSIEYLLSKELYHQILNNNPSAKEPNLYNWAKDIDLMLRIDKRTVEDIRGIIEFSQRDSFWSSNILSTKKLREKFDQLKVKSNKFNPKTNKINNDWRDVEC